MGIVTEIYGLLLKEGKTLEEIAKMTPDEFAVMGINRIVRKEKEKLKEEEKQ